MVPFSAEIIVINYHVIYDTFEAIKYCKSTKSEKAAEYKDISVLWEKILRFCRAMCECQICFKNRIKISDCDKKIIRKSIDQHRLIDPNGVLGQHKLLDKYLYNC